jgi:para-nitrobenzyl esterase
MQDIVMSLRWVHDNIARFGGDPGNVTVFGESGGGRKVSTLMAMPSAKGLFHRAIAQSGVALRFPSAEEGTKVARAVLDKLGVSPNNLAALHQLPPEKIAAATPPDIGPVVDGELIPRNPFDPEAPAVSADVPMLLGNNLTEATFFNNTPTEPIDDAMLATRVAEHTKLDADKAASLIAHFRKGYPDAPNHLVYQLIATDWWLGGNVHLQAERKAAQGKAPAYVYQFAMPQGARGGRLNVPHTAEIAYVFDNLKLSTALVGEVTPGHQALADRMSAAWVNFARTGNPNGRGVPAWKPYSRADRQVMVFGPKIGPAPAAVTEGALAVNALRAA